MQTMIHVKRRYRDLYLLPKDLLIKTGPVDYAEWNYHGILGHIQRQRFLLIRKLINTQRFDNLLEIGYGSGVFVPELTKYCKNYYGIDKHDKNKQVARQLQNIGIESTLKQTSISSLPFPNEFFDCIVGVSIFEFVNDLESSCQEVKRVLNVAGKFFIVIAGFSPLIDLGLKILTGRSAKDDFEDRRQRAISSLMEHFSVERILYYPSIAPFGMYIYRSFKMKVR